MKRKGFTLVELLAVIVILAVIALIAVPQVIKIINQSRTDAKEASLRSAFKVLETGIATGKYKVNVPVNLKDIEMDNNPFDNGEITYSSSSKDVYYAYEEKTGELVSGSKESLSAPEDTNIDSLANQLRDNISSSNITTDGYITGGLDTKNYVKISETGNSEAKYRAVRIHPDGRVLVVRDTAYTIAPYDCITWSEQYNGYCSSGSTNNFANSSIKKYLNCLGGLYITSGGPTSDCFLTQINSHDYITETIWDTRCYLDYEDNYMECKEGDPTTTVAKVGLLTLSDILKVGIKIYDYSNTYLTNDFWWTSTGFGLSSNFAWHVNDSGIAYLDESITSKYVSVRPAFTLKSGLEIESGDGTFGTPFVIN